jgi:hypothetical protein
MFGKNFMLPIAALPAVLRAKRSHFQPSVEVGMKSVDKNIDERNKQRFGSESAL